VSVAKRARGGEQRGNCVVRYADEMITFLRGKKLVC
jgi:hypothetical protein